MKSVDLLILSWHQTYLSKNAGGYIRLREFLKRAPKTINFKLLDNTPTIYDDVVSQNQLIQYRTPEVIKIFEKRFFILWFFLENITTAWIIYFVAKKLVHQHKPKVLYVPIGEFFHLYLPAILLKWKFPKIKLVVDILNFEIPDKTVVDYYAKLRSNGIGIIRSLLAIYATIQSSFLIKHTIRHIDYVFTVSSDLLLRLKKYYKKNSINFTPSGVTIPKVRNRYKKNYLGVYVGRITVQKGVFDLLEVWTFVIKKIPNARLAIAGQVDTPTLTALHKKVKELNLERHVEVFGPISESKKLEILAQSELFLHLARYEPLFPVIGILEGLSHGLPALVYEMQVISSQKKLTEKYPCLFIAQNGNINQVCNIILKYSNSSRGAKLLLSKQAKNFAELYNWDTIAKKEWSIIRNSILSFDF